METSRSVAARERVFPLSSVKKLFKAGRGDFDGMTPDNGRKPLKRAFLEALNFIFSSLREII
jgi:hypothetical protein